MKSIISFPFLAIGTILRILLVGVLSGLFCIYTVDYLLSSSFGTFNLVIITVYCSAICTFTVVFVECFYWLQRKSKKKTPVETDKAKYDLK